MMAEALSHHRSGRARQAEQLYCQALMRDADHADAWNLFGVLLLETGRPALAVDALRRAVALTGAVASYRSNLGNALKANGQLNESIACYCDALAIRPDDPLALSNLAAALWQQGQNDQAAALCRRAIELDPGLAEAHTNLGNAIKDTEGAAEAIACYRRAIALAPSHAQAHMNLGNALDEQGEVKAAVACHRRAIALQPALAGAHYNLAVTLCKQNHMAEGIACYRAAIENAPDLADAHYNLALALLSTGNLAEGWREIEWRWKTARMRPVQRTFPQPLWRGEPAAGQTLLIHAEQGFGDTIQFSRYAPMAAAMGSRIVLLAPPPLVRLLRTLRGIDHVVAEGDALPPFDLHCPVLSLPLAFGTTLETIPAPAPYLSVDTAAAAAWRVRLAGLADRGARVGLAWAGNPHSRSREHALMDRRRSLPPSLLVPVLGVPGCRFFSLQKAGAAAPDGFGLTDFMPQMADFADTAALIANLDLVISVDTAVAHLAAALGKPVWLLERFDSCWRWLNGRRDSPWYPTMRLYRQTAAGDWDTVLAEVASDLGSFVNDNII